MSKRDGFHLEFYKEGVLTLPEDENERKEAARTLLGGSLVACVDNWIEYAERILQVNSEFEEFTQEQKAALLDLVSHTAYGALFSQCVEIDNLAFSALEINFNEHDEEGKVLRSTTIASGNMDELHDASLDWMERFGDHYNPNIFSRFLPLPAMNQR